MNTQYLNYFLKLAKTKNIVAAAAELNMSPQGLMKAISRMEEELGCRLFKKTSLGMETTPEGAYFTSYARSMLEEYELCHRVLSDGSFSVNHVNIAASVGILSEFAARVIKDFKSMHPEYTVIVYELSQDECDEAVRTGSADIGFGFEPFSADFDSFRVYSLSSAVIVRKSHPLASEHVITPEMISGLSMVLSGRKDKTSTVFLEKMNAARTVPVVEARVNSFLEMIKLVSMYPWAGLTNVSAASDIQSDDIVCIPLEAPNLLWNIGVYRKTGKMLSKASEEFYQYCMSVPASRKIIPVRPEDLD